MKLFTWPLADAIATALGTSMGDFKLLEYSGSAPAANLSVTPALADVFAQTIITEVGNFKVHLFTGTQPATSTLLAGSLTGYTRLITFQAKTVESGKYPMKWAALVTGSGTAARDQTHVDEGTAAASGTATWGVIANVDDTLGSSATADRIAFTVGTSGADVNLANVSFTSGLVYPYTDSLTVSFSGISTPLTGALGTPLVSYIDAGGAAGLDWDTVATGSALLKRLISQGAQGTAAATNSVTYAVVCPYTDNLGSSSSAQRILFTVGTSGAGITVSDISRVSGVVYPHVAPFGIGPALANTA
jgi:hypothetical protein